ncbi:MAG: phage major capsid protein [Oscillospiraceae bacterium]|nr:phage major capsid protein [Oscillospiraceae bacterium]
MALKALLLRKKIDEQKKALAVLREKDKDFDTREAELKKSIAEVTEETSKEDRDALDELVTRFDEEKQAHEDEKAKLDKVVGDLETELAAEEAAQDTTPPAGTNPPADNGGNENERKDARIMNKRYKVFANMSEQERSAFAAREDVKAYLAEVRTAIKEKRAITNIGLTIPEVMLGILRQNIEGYSKLYKHCTVRRISGEGRLVVMGAIPEAIWTECCATLNELSIGFNDFEVDCYKVAGYFAVCNANLEDSDLNLAAELMDAIGQAIGLALDKAILYGRNASGTQKMPQGIVSRLVQTAAPSGYPSTARTWVDLHTSNVKTIANTNTGIALFQQIALQSGAMKGKYARGGKVWCMNETTRTFLIAQAMTINAAGAIATGMGNQMPVLGGDIEILEFLPDNVIVAGYFELYFLAERAGQKFAQSEHVRFIQDQTVMKGTARYDGGPVIAEAFMAIGVNGTTPNATMTFASDTANT